MKRSEEASEYRNSLISTSKALLTLYKSNLLMLEYILKLDNIPDNDREGFEKSKEICKSDMMKLSSIIERYFDR